MCRFTTFVASAVLCFGGLLSLVAAPNTVAEIPAVLTTSTGLKNHGYPEWVRAEEAIDAEGRFRTEHFHELAQRRLDGFFREPVSAEDCLEVTEYYVSEVNPPDRSTLAKAVADSPLIFVAEVIDQAFGLQWAQPGQLLEVAVTDELRGEARHATYFVFLPVGRFTLGSHSICKTDSRYPAPPAAGDEVLVLVSSRRNSDEQLLKNQYPTEVVPLYEGGSVGLPKAFTRERESGLGRQPPATRVELLAYVRRLISEADGG